jgi:serine/threonine protein kinase
MLVISNHRLESVIAHGVTSELWSAVRLGPGGFAQTVALKTLTPLHAASPPHVRAFLNESRAAGHVHHPNVVKTHEVIEEDGRYWLSMDLVRGWSLRSLVATLRLTRRLMPLEIAVALVRDAASGVHAIHAAGLLHRHVSPGNTMASAQGHAVVLDFGNAAWQLAEQVRFTPPLTELDRAYASPQMVARHRVDVRTDVYSLGAVLHELVTGEAPPSAGGRQVFIAPSSWRPDLPPALEGIIGRTLDDGPAGRFATALELAQVLDSVAAQERWNATPPAVAAFLAEVFGGTAEQVPRPPAGRAPLPTPIAGVAAAREPSRGVEYETDPFVRAAPPRPAPPPPARSVPPPTPPRPARRTAPPPRPVARAPLPMPNRAMVPRSPPEPMRAPARAAPASAVRPAQPPQAQPPPRRPGDLAAGSGARRMRPDEMPEEKTDPRLGTAIPTRVRFRR